MLGCFKMSYMQFRRKINKMKNIPGYVDYSALTCDHTWVRSREIGCGCELVCKHCGALKIND